MWLRASGTATGSALRAPKAQRVTRSGSARTQVEIALAKAGYATVTSRSRLERDATLNVQMPRGAVLSGRVVDASGVPVVAAQVVARREDPAQARDVNGPAFFVATTDDLGEFRLGGLPAGRYVMGAAMPSSPLTLLVPAGSTSSSLGSRAGGPPPPPPPAPLSTAIVVRPPNPQPPRPPRTDAEAPAPADLRPGDELRGLEVAVPAPMSSADIRRFAYERLREIAAELGRQPPPDTRCLGGASMRGRVSLTSGEPLGGVTVRLTRFPRAIATAITGPDGNIASRPTHADVSRHALALGMALVERGIELTGRLPDL